MPAEYTALPLMVIGALLVVVGAAWGPETKDVDFSEEVEAAPAAAGDWAPEVSADEPRTALAPNVRLAAPRPGLGTSRSLKDRLVRDFGKACARLVWCTRGKAHAGMIDGARVFGLEQPRRHVSVSDQWTPLVTDHTLAVERSSIVALTAQRFATNSPV
jgi:hypothetical protein